MKNTVAINVGVISNSERNDSLSIIRGSRLPVKVQKGFNASQVLKEAITKHSNHDQFFCGLEDYDLLYPDQKVVDYIPGTDDCFTVEKYKKELAKPYSKIDLYLCKVHDISEQSDAIEFDNNKFTNSQISGIFDDNNTTGLITDFDAFLNNSSVYSPLLDAEFSTKKEKGQQDLLPMDNCASSSTSNHTASARVTVHQVFCPICNKKFDTSVIEEHADACLASKHNPFSITILDSEDDEIPDNSHAEIEDSKELVTKTYITSTVRTLIQSGAFEINMENSLQLNIRRRFIFSDFTKYFCKKWNVRKKNCLYTISFIGESGLDTGGVSREFYSGDYIMFNSITVVYFV